MNLYMVKIWYGCESYQIIIIWAKSEQEIRNKLKLGSTAGLIEKIEFKNGWAILDDIDIPELD